MLTFKDKYSFSLFSQNGEDGIIQEILRRIGAQGGICVEFGATDGYYCSNTRNLINQGWNGFMYDIDPSGMLASDVQKKEVTPENVNDLPQCNVLSIDIDGNDYEVWKAYTGKPEVVIIEINSDIEPERFVYDKGTSYLPMLLLGIAKGYFLLCHTGNLIFIRNDLKHHFPELTADPIADIDQYFDRSWLR